MLAVFPFVFLVKLRDDVLLEVFDGVAPGDLCKLCEVLGRLAEVDGLKRFGFGAFSVDLYLRATAFGTPGRPFVNWGTVADGFIWFK